MKIVAGYKQDSKNISLYFPLKYSYWDNQIDARKNGDLAATVSAIGSSNVTLIVSDTQIISANLTIPSTTHLVIVEGGSISDSSNANLTINGSFDAPLSKVFNWTGSGAVSFGSGTIVKVYPEWWGIDGSSDEVQINAAITAAPVDGTVWLNGAYSTDAEVAVNKKVHIDGQGSISATPTLTALATDHVVNVSAAGATIRNITITGDHPGFPATNPGNTDAYNNIHITSNDVLIENVKSVDSYSIGISVYSSANNVKLLNNTITNYYLVGVNLETLITNAVVEGNYIGDLDALPSWATRAIRLSNADYCTIAENTMKDYGHRAIEMFVSDVGTSCDHNTITGNTAVTSSTAATYGISMDGAANDNTGYGCSYNTIVGNSFNLTSDAAYGISVLNGSSFNVIAGNIFLNVKFGYLVRNGVAINGSNEDAMGNEFINNVIDTCTDYAIQIYTKGNIVRGNTLVDIGDASGTLDAIYIYKYQTHTFIPTDTIIENNALLVRSGSLLVSRFIYARDHGSGVIRDNYVDLAALKTTTPTAGLPVLVSGTNVLNWQLGGNTTPKLATADATVTTAWYANLEDEHAAWVWADVVAIQAGGAERAAYHIKGLFYRDGGGATLQGALVTDTVESDGAWACTLDTSGNNVRLRITGDAANAVDWTWRIQWVKVTD